jgi:hypothetical protein
MGIDCSNCKCTNREDEKILIVDNYKKINRKGKMEYSYEVQDKLKSKFVAINDILEKNPPLIIKVIQLQSLIRKYKDRKIYKAILEKYREKQNYFSFEELQETLSSRKIKDAQNFEKSYTYRSGAIYSGQWLGGFRHGRGLMKWADGTYYEGEWNLGYAEGKGMVVYMNGDYMKGDYMYNKLNSFGECFNNELAYEYKGYWENDLQSGQGI